MAHASFQSSPAPLFPDNHALPLVPLAIPASNATTLPLPSFIAAQPYQIPGRRPRSAFIIFREVFLAFYKNILPRQQTEVSRIAAAIWRGLSEEQQLLYQQRARVERETYERDNPVPASQRRVSAGGNGSRNSRERKMIPSQSVVDLLHELVAQGMDAQTFLYRVPTDTPTAAPEIPRVQYSTSFMMNGNTDAVFHDVHTTWQGQGMTDVHLGQATQGVQTSHQWPASASIPTATPETSVSDSRIPDAVSYYHGTSGQSFAVMNQTAIPQYLPSPPVVAPIARRPNPDPVSFTHQQLDGNTYNRNNGWGELSTTHASASSSMEVGSSNHGRGSNHGGGSSAYYEHSAENTWDDSQYRQHQPWSSGYSGQPS